MKISGSVTSCATSKLITPGTLRLAADRSANFLRASSIFCGYTFPDTRKIIMRRAFSPYDVSWLRSLQFCPYDFPACVLREIPIPFIADSFHQQQSPAALRVSAYAHTCWWLRAGIPDENHDPRTIHEQHQRNGVMRSVARDACIALVTSSETRSSTLSLKRVSPHSHSNWRACSRAQGNAPGSAPSSMKSCSGHSLSMPVPWYWGGRTGTGAPLFPGLRTDNTLPGTVPVPPPAAQATPAATRGVYALVLPFIGNLPASPGWGGR